MQVFIVCAPRHGEMSEWLKEHAWKACMWETASGVRIPLSPPLFILFIHKNLSPKMGKYPVPTISDYCKVISMSLGFVKYINWGKETFAYTK